MKKNNKKNCEWIADANGDLVLYRNGRVVNSARIPKIMIDYSVEEDGEMVRVNVNALMAHIEQEHNCD